MIHKVKEFLVDADEIMNGGFQERVKFLVDRWKEELDAEGFVIVTPTIDLEVVSPFNSLTEPVKVLVSLGVEEKPRDIRWENVSAHISSPPQGYFYEDENLQFNPAELTEFLIEVRYGKQVFYSKIIVDNKDLEDARLRIYNFTLDKMVEQIDYYISISQKEEQQ